MSCDVEGSVRPAAGIAGDLLVRVADSADSIDASDWERLSCGASFYSSRRWLRSIEDDPWHDVWYLTAVDSAGRLQAVVPVYLSSSASPMGSDSFYDPATVFFNDAGAGPGDGASATADRWRPTLLVGGRTGYDTDLLIDPELSPTERALVLSAVDARVERLGQAWDVPTRAAMYLRADTARELAPWYGSTPLLTELNTAIDLTGLTGVDDYLSSLSSHRRHWARRELRDFAVATPTLRWTTLGESAHQIAPLLATHHQRYGHSDTADLLARHLEEQAQWLDDISHVLICEDAGAVVGALLAYEWQGVWYARLVAAGEGLRGRGAAFFSLAFYAPILAAIEHGARRYVLGPSGIRTKLARGARVEPRWSVLAGDDESGRDVSTLNGSWNDAQIARWAGEFGIPPASLAIAEG